MLYLHESPLRYHGNLKTSNCLVDSRWVLKLTDFGLQEFKKDSEDFPHHFLQHDFRLQKEEEVDCKCEGITCTTSVSGQNSDGHILFVLKRCVIFRDTRAINLKRIVVHRRKMIFFSFRAFVHCTGAVALLQLIHSNVVRHAERRRVFVFYYPVRIAQPQRSVWGEPRTRPVGYFEENYLLFFARRIESFQVMFFRTTHDIIIFATLHKAQ